MYYDALQKIGLKRLPPILIPIGIPFVIVAILGMLLFLLFAWILGFWRCESCKKTFWIIHNRKTRKPYEGRKKHTCDACLVMKTLTDDNRRVEPRAKPLSRIGRTM